ncbi:hypothetical protein D3C79_809880 [compost metagenome]
MKFLITSWPVSPAVHTKDSATPLLPVTVLLPAPTNRMLSSLPSRDVEALSDVSLAMSDIVLTDADEASSPWDVTTNELCAESPSWSVPVTLTVKFRSLAAFSST